MFLRGKADKVIMTMVTLIGTPASSTSRSTSRTSPITCCPFKEPNESILTPCHHDTPTFLTPAGLRGIPTNVPTTAAAPADDDDDRMRCHPPATLDEDNHTLTPFDPQEWANFYNDFIQFANSFNNATTRINEELITPTDDNPKGIDRID